MRTCVVAIARLENLYIREWVEHYLKLGFGHIFLFDNNIFHEEVLGDPIQDYMESDQVTIMDARDIKWTQPQMYNAIYSRLYPNFDWVLFCDIDEFLILKNCDDVKDYLSDKVFNDYDVIKLNWMTMTDNDLIYYDDRPVMERFTTPALSCTLDTTSSIKDIRENQNCKCFVRTGIVGINIGVHCPMIDVMVRLIPLRYCDCVGDPIKEYSDIPSNSMYLKNVNYSRAYIKHFRTKTIEEYVRTKMRRGWQCFQDDYEYIINDVLNLHMFFNINKKTLEKEELAYKLIEELKIPYRKKR